MSFEKKPLVGVSFDECLRRVLSGEYECHHAPEDQVEPGEVVLGTLKNEKARGMFSLWREMEEGLKKFKESIPEDRDSMSKNDMRSLRIHMHQFNSRINCVREIFWEQVYSDFSQARDSGVTVGIRADWTIVIFKSAQCSFLDLFGGGS
jgi:hypothetical protein